MIKAEIVVDFPKWRTKIKNPNLYFKKKIKKLSSTKLLKKKNFQFTLLLTNKTIIKKLNKNGVTIILTTHYLEEAEKVCDYIAIINKGMVIACEKKKQLLDLIDIKQIQVKLDKPLKKIPRDLEKYIISKK